jgi:hypothetical protein
LTEFEFREAIAALYAQVSQDSAMYFTLVSAYLIVAYLAGMHLKKVQIRIVNTLFGTWAMLNAFSVFANLQGAARLAKRFNEAGFTYISNHDSSSVLIVSYTYSALLILGVLAAFYFMRSVRHPKAE